MVPCSLTEVLAPSLLFLTSCEHGAAAHCGLWRVAAAGMSAGGQRERKEKEWIVVDVSDTGEGISDEEKERVFEMFYTGGNPIADSRRSIGLGLFLCKSIIEAHGGEMKLYNNVPHGSVFRFSLPAGEVSLHE